MVRVLKKNRLFLKSFGFLLQTLILIIIHSARPWRAADGGSFQQRVACRKAISVSLGKEPMEMGDEGVREYEEYEHRFYKRFDTWYTISCSIS